MDNGKLTTVPDHRAAADAAAAAILVEHEGCYSIRDLLATAWLRGRVTGFADGMDSALDQIAAQMIERKRRHARVITGTGNSGERRELAALCRGLRSAP